MTLYDRLHALGLTLEHVAKETGLAFSTVWRCFEADKLPQSKPNQRAVLRVLKWSEADFAKAREQAPTAAVPVPDAPTGPQPSADPWSAGEGDHA